MKSEQIQQELAKINAIAQDNSFAPGNVASRGASQEDFNHNWLVNTIRNYHAAHTTPIDSLEDVIEIIHLFSGTDRKEISDNVHDKQKHLFEFVNGDDNYLHYIKSPKV